jgi:hypothetical protein
LGTAQADIENHFVLFLMLLAQEGGELRAGLRRNAGSLNASFASRLRKIPDAQLSGCKPTTASRAHGDIEAYIPKLSFKAIRNVLTSY